MTDYVSILSRAIGENSTYDSRRAVYERARHALLSQLRNAEPPLAESDITKQRLSLENAIRDVEAQVSAGKTPVSVTENSKRLETRASETGSKAVESVVSPPILQEKTPEPPKPLTAEKKGDPLLNRVSTYPKAAGLRDIKRPSNFIIMLILVALVAAGGVVAAWFMVRGHVSGDAEQEMMGAKISDRVAQDPSLHAEKSSVAQTAYLVEENVDSKKGVENFRGKVAWRVDSQDNPQGAGPEKVISGLVEIPGRNLKMRMIIRRNTDKSLPASHTIELLFDVPKDFANGAVESIAGIRLKPSEQANGLPLASAAVRITTGYFLVAMSAAAEDTNIVLLRDRPWMDVLLLYRNGRRAVLSIEKGLQGENVFNEAFKSWGAN